MKPSEQIHASFFGLLMLGFLYLMIGWEMVWIVPAILLGGTIATAIVTCYCKFEQYLDKRWEKKHPERQEKADQERWDRYA